jgi:transketolase
MNDWQLDKLDKATRDTFGEALKAIGAEDPRVVVLDADLSVSTKSAAFGKAFPDRFFQMGIAEQNMVGTAAGLAFTGFVPFLCSFGAFVAGRFETIRVSIGYSQANVKIVGTHAGLGVGEDGYTQMGLEDVALMRAIPGMTVLQPCDAASTFAAVKWAAQHSGPVYLRLTRQKLPKIHADPSTFQVGRGIVLREGKGLALVGSGAGTAEAMRAARELVDRNPWVVDMPTLKPLDRALVRRLASDCKAIVTVEDHNVVGGLGSAMAEVLAEEGFGGRLLRVGVQDTYGQSGQPQELYERYGLSAKKIVERVRTLPPFS